MASNARAADHAAETLVWDLPVRLFHWGLVTLIAFSWWSAENGKTQWHVWSGLSILFLLLFRILWGVLGSSTAQFRSFVTGPARVMGYVRHPAGWRGIGHSPLAALSVIALMSLVALQIAFGLPMSDEDGTVTGPLNRLVSFDTAEWAHGVHELLFKALLALIALHVAAILFYRWKGQHLARAMVTGKSIDYPPGTPGLVRAGAGRLIICVGIALAMTFWIAQGVPGL